MDEEENSHTIDDYRSIINHENQEGSNIFDTIPGEQNSRTIEFSGLNINFRVFDANKLVAHISKSRLEFLGGVSNGMVFKYDNENNPVALKFFVRATNHEIRSKLLNATPVQTDITKPGLNIYDKTRLSKLDPTQEDLLNEKEYTDLLTEITLSEGLAYKLGSEILPRNINPFVAIIAHNNVAIGLITPFHEGEKGWDIPEEMWDTLSRSGVAYDPTDFGSGNVIKAPDGTMKLVDLQLNRKKDDELKSATNQWHSQNNRD